MLEEAKNRTIVLQARLRDLGIRRAVFTDESSIAYLAGFWGYLGIEFGRPSMLVVEAEDAPIVITPFMESEMVSAMTWVEDVRVWEDSRTQSAGPRGGDGENVGTKRNRQKRGRAQFFQSLRPTPPKLEDLVSSDEVQPPFPAGITPATPPGM